MMIIKRIISGKVFQFSFLFLLLILIFYRLPLTFFQQDEWRAFGVMAIFEQNLVDGLKMLLPKTFFEHFNIVTFLMEYLQFKLFHLNFAPFALMSLILHFLNSLLIYYLVFNISGKKSLSLITSIIFITSSIYHQATTWMSAGTSAQGAALFGLISLIYFLKYIKNRQEEFKFFLFSLISFAVSLMFKESSIFLFIFFPIIWLIFINEKNFSKFIKIILPLFLVFIFYMMLRGLFLFNNFDIESAGFRMENNEEKFRTTASTYIYRIADLPFKALPQSIFTATFLTSLSNKLVLTAYPHWLVAADGAANPYVVESVAFDYIGFILSILIILLAVLIFNFFKTSKDYKAILLLKFSLVLMVVSYFPFIFIPGRGGFISIAEPRNLYIPGIGSSIFIALSIMAISSFISKKIKYINSFVLVVILVVLLISTHIKNIWRDLQALQERSEIRLGILKTISSYVPSLSEKIIFYTESDTAYYGLVEKALPFQSGFGRTLLVWYYGNGEKIPACFFYKDWLYHQDKDEGYKYCEGKGFGYFREFESLKKALNDNNLSSENVVSFSWSSRNNQFVENTSEIRQRLKQN